LEAKSSDYVVVAGQVVTSKIYYTYTGNMLAHKVAQIAGIEDHRCNEFFLKIFSTFCIPLPPYTQKVSCIVGLF